jgi:uncharacterized UPF0160 family protein
MKVIPRCDCLNIAVIHRIAGGRILPLNRLGARCPANAAGLVFGKGFSGSQAIVFPAFIDTGSAGLVIGRAGRLNAELNFHGLGQLQPSLGLGVLPLKIGWGETKTSLLYQHLGTTMTQPQHLLVTHAGAFHADEAMAVVLLERFYMARPVRVAKGLSNAQTMALAQGKFAPEITPQSDRDGLWDARTPSWLVRSRDPAVLAVARANPQTFVIDVGGELDRAKLNFDHHQSTMTEGWPNGTPYSSTGLVWLWLKEHGHLNTLSGAIQDELERSLIQPLDAHDNGRAVCEIGQVCESYNRGNQDIEQQLEQFEKAIAVLDGIFDNHLHLASVRLEAEQTLRTGWAQAQARGEKHVVLEEGLAYTDGTGLLKEISNDEAEILAIPGKGNRYSLISLAGNGGRFSVKCPMPEEWRGKMDQDVVLEGQTVRLVFAHKTGFMAIVQGGPNDAHRVARHVVAHNRATVLPSNRSRGPG